jgi:transcriptional regulator GlxA family with amidase domain
MVTCLSDGDFLAMSAGQRRHCEIMAGFEHFLEQRISEPVYLSEICAATGASERTVRLCCQEHLGMSPVKYLWLRRMYLARNALKRACIETATVTQIATDTGFWELGRFATEYNELFGELPSVTLRQKRCESKPGQRAAADSEFA